MKLRKLILSCSSILLNSQIMARLRPMESGFDDTKKKIVQPARERTETRNMLDFAKHIADTYNKGGSFEVQKGPPTKEKRDWFDQPDVQKTLHDPAPSIDLTMKRFRDGASRLWEVKYYTHSGYWMCEDESAHLLQFHTGSILSNEQP